MDPTALNLPDVVAEVRAAFERYEAALLANDVPLLNDYFWTDARVVRYGISEHSEGIDAVRRARRALAPVPKDRRLHRTTILTFGHDAATVCTEFDTPGSARLGRQMQVWARIGSTWRIVAAHVSEIERAALVRY